VETPVSSGDIVGNLSVHSSISAQPLKIGGLVALSFEHTQFIGMRDAHEPIWLINL